MDEIKRALDLLMETGQVAELRALGYTPDGKYPKVIYGYFNDTEKMAREALKLTRHAKGVYLTINPVNPALLARCANRCKSADKDPATSDHDVIGRRWLPIDTDPDRPAGICASDKEKAAAIKKAMQIKESLFTRGWPDPIVADSGNGGHLLYRIDLPADDGGLVQNCLKALSEQFDGGGVIVDQKNFNPSRIWKMYGTWARKGDDTPDRPHRQARIIKAPQRIEVVQIGLLKTLAGSVKRPEPAKERYRGGKDFDLRRWIVDVGVVATEKQGSDGSTRWEMDCPWNSSHRGNGFIILRSNGAIAAGCNHNSCTGHNWQEYREMMEPGCYDRKEPEKKPKKKRPQMPPIPQPGPGEAMPTPDEIRDRLLPAKDTPMGNAERMREQYGKDLAHHPALGWYAWNGQHWERDTPLRFAMYREMSRGLFVDAAKETDGPLRETRWKWAKRSETRAIQNETFELLESESGIRVDYQEWDADPLLIGANNGIIDLKEGILREGKQEDRISLIAPVRYDPFDECPTWLAFLDNVTGGDQEMVSFLQRAVGYTLTGSIQEQIMFLLHGNGANGKSTFLGTLLAMFGPMGKTVAADLLTQRKHDQTSYWELAPLVQARMVVAAEAEEGRKLAESRVKDLTGGERINACYKYKDPFEFLPAFKLWYCTNHLPQIRGTDEGIWRRICKIPFDVRIPPEDRDPLLGTKLKAELPGILAWAVEGCVVWQSTGLLPPKKVQEATAEYREDQDRVAAFFDECCILGPQKSAKSKDLYRAYVQFCEETGEFPLSQKRLAGRLLDRGLQKEHHDYGTLWIGVGLVTEQTEFGRPREARLYE